LSSDESEQKKNEEEHEQKKEREEKKKKEFELRTTQAIFLGGITFTAMVFVMQSRASFNFEYIPYYPEILVTMLAGTSSLFILSINGFIVRASFGVTKGTKLLFNLSAVAIACLLIVIPLLLLPFSPIGALIVAILEVVVLAKADPYKGAVGYEKS
jgi:hypothetical protein